MRQKENGQAKKGMNRTTHPSEIQGGEYSFGLNVNIQSENEGASITLQNENSNTLCSRFLEGYIVLKSHYDRVSNRIYYFLLNEDTGCSEIGYIASNQHIEGNETIEINCGCDIVSVIEEGLETISEYEASCEYVTLLSDYCKQTGGCSGCLNFSKEHGIKDVVIRHAKTGDELYFTDGHNPQRFVKLDKIEDYFLQKDPCSGEVEEVCLKCDELDVFRQFSIPCLRASALVEGGALRAGTYTVFIAYADSTRTTISEYIRQTNPITIRDPNRNIVSQNNLDYITNFGIKLGIENLDKEFEYFKVVVLYKSGIDPGSLNYYDYGIFSTDVDSVLISELSESSPKVPLSEINEFKPTYLTADGMTSAGGFLIQHGLKQKPLVNLQPVVNMMGSFAKWATVEYSEGLYKDGALASNYKGYLRDEVYPKGIEFFDKKGYKYPLLPLISRPPTSYDLDLMVNNGVYEDDNVESILQGSSKCYPSERKYRWQFENTASKEGIFSCGGGTETVESVETDYCYSEEIYEVLDGVIEQDTIGGIQDWINNNKEYILTSQEEWLEDIKEALEHNYGDCSCEEDDRKCEYDVLEEEVVLVEVVGEKVKLISTPYEGYQNHIEPPEECENYMLDDSEEKQHDTDVEDALGYNKTVWEKNTPSNNSCGTAILLPSNTGIMIGSHLKDEWSSGSNTSLLTNKDVSFFDGVEFFDKLHTNAIWYEVNFQGAQGIIIEVSNVVCETSDDNTDNRVRVTFWDGCGDLQDVQGYGRIIDLGQSVFTQNNFIFLDANDFPSGNVYVSIDSPLYTSYEVELTFSNTNSGNGVLEIDGTPLTVQGGATGNDVATNFTTTNQTYLNNNNIDYSIVGDTLLLRLTPDQYNSLNYTPDSGSDLDVNYSIKEEYFTLQPPCGCLNVAWREAFFMDALTYEKLVFQKRCLVESTCQVEVPSVSFDCDPLAYEYGSFAYVESNLRYPCNEELYDSSWLKVKASDVPSSIKTKFENFFTNSGAIDSNGDYVLDVSETNFQDKPIRHFKYPDNNISPFMYNGGSSLKGDSFIYPLGFKIDNEVVNFFLDLAVYNGILTQEEREDIVGYNLYRGDRRTERSIIAKGVGVNVLNRIDYQQGGFETIYYQNFPLNDQNVDDLNYTIGDINYDFLMFYSPETLFRKPSLGSEVNIEGYLSGVFNNTFVAMQDHPRFTILGDKALKLAKTLAVAEVLFDNLMQGFMATMEGTYLGSLYDAASIGVRIVMIVLLALNAALNTAFAIAKHRYQWLETFRNLGNGYNHAYIGLSEGYYNKFIHNTESDSKYRALRLATYLSEGDVRVRDTKGVDVNKFNNFKRETGVLFKLGSHPMVYESSLINKDRSREQIAYDATGQFSGRKGETNMPYLSMKQYRPEQWGNIETIKWLPTNNCTRLNEEEDCSVIYGGDIFISRLSFKKKFPFFRETAHRLANDLPFKYSSYFNNSMTLGYVTDSKQGYVDFLTDNEYDGVGGMIKRMFIENKTGYKLYSSSGLHDSENNPINDFYVGDKYKFLTRYYGVPSVLVESEINCFLRHGETGVERDFIPNVPDVVDWIQDSVVPIGEKEYFLYNGVYSATPEEKRYSLLPSNYNKVDYDKLDDLTNTVIWSQMDNQDSSSLRSPWLNYKANNSNSFNRSYGKLIDIRGLESDNVLVRFTDGYGLYKTQEPPREMIQKSENYSGFGYLFASLMGVNHRKTDLGFGGTQHKEMLSTPYGHFYVDAKRGQVFMLAPSGGEMSVISAGLDKWFKEHLPFKILRKIPEANIDNVYNGAGIAMGWDDVFKRVFLTKRDYIPKQREKYGYEEGVGYYIVRGREREYIDLEDKYYFEEAHFTIAYSPITQTWISYYSFIPNYYNSLNSYFQTGVNQKGGKKHGVWSHHPFISSYQVFYGELHPFIVEHSLSTKASKGMLVSVNYWLEARKYYNKYDFSNIFGKSFNKAYIYNDFQNSGELRLKFHENNNRLQALEYPKVGVNHTEILQSEIENNWSFNSFYNLIKNERAGVPIWSKDNVDIEKFLNDYTLDYSLRRKDRLRGDYFLVRMVQDEDSRFKLLYRIQQNERDYY